jgi:hypothetical protein
MAEKVAQTMKDALQNSQERMQHKLEELNNHLSLE